MLLSDSKGYSLNVSGAGQGCLLAVWNKRIVAQRGKGESGPHKRRGEERRDLEIGHKGRWFYSLGKMHFLSWARRGDPYVHKDSYACGMPGFCGCLRGQRAHRLSEGNPAADGLHVLRDAGKGREVRDRGAHWNGFAEQEDPGSAVPGVYLRDRQSGVP